MKDLNTLFLGAVLLLCAFSVRAQVSSDKHQSKPQIDHGQRWQKLWSEGKPFTEVRAAFYEDYAGVPIDQIPRYKQFKRTENLLLPRLSADGHYHPGSTLNQYQGFKQSQSGSRAATANWSFIGPATVPSFVNFQEGIGRVDRISFHPTDANTYWVSTPTQGLWKTTDNGASWTALADDWTGLGMGDVVVDPSNTNNIYVATSSGDVGAIAGFGIMKSTDGGATYASSGLTSITAIHKLMIDPANSNRLFAATNAGLYVTTDGAATWTLHAGIAAGVVYDLEFKPGDPSVIYLAVNNAGSVEFRKSTDSGATFSNIAMPYVPTNASRTLIAVTPHDANYVYVLTASSATAGIEGVYRSTDSGSTFTKVSTGNELITYPNGDPHTLRVTDVVSTNSAWGWILGVSPTNRDDIYVGAVWICRSTDGGASWQDIGDSNHGGIGVHVDYHDIKWHPSTGLLYLASDGGIYRDNGSWPMENISEGLGIQQNYTFDSSQDGTQILTGNQDNGTFLFDGTSWSHWGSGDGMTCFFDPGNASTVYGSLQLGLGIIKSTNSGAGAVNILSTGETGQTGAFEVKFRIHPFYREHLFAAYEDIWKTTDGGSSWINLTNGALTGTGSLSMLEISEADPDIMVAGSDHSGRYYKTTDGGSSWTELTNLNGFVTDLQLHPTNANIMWATNTAIGEVAKSTDGGSTWTDISGTLPANLTNCITYQQDSPNDAIYIGQDLGIYYLDNTLGDWVLFDQGLPSVIVRELEALPCIGKLRAATYGRGVWESDLYTYTPASVCCPVAIPTVETVACNTTADLTAATAPSGHGYQWYKDDVLLPTETGQTLTVNAGGNYYAVYDDGSCDSFHSNGVAVDFSAPTVESSAMLGDALDMAGGDDHLAIAHNASVQLGQSFTIEFWAQSSAEFSGIHYILRKEVAYGIDLANGNDLTFVTWGDDIVYTDGFLNDGSWHHYAFVADNGTQKRFYRDGKLIDTNNNAFFTDQDATPLYIGFPVNPAQMQIDEVRIWNDARTEAEIQNNAFCSIDCRTSDLVLYLPFEDGTANGTNTGIAQVRDYSPSGNHATIASMALTGTASNFVSGAKNGFVAGPSNVCANIGETFEVASIPAATGYSWTLPSGWNGSSSINSIAPSDMVNSGNVSVTATLACGNPTFSRTVNSYGVCKTALQFDAVDDQVDLGTGINLANTSWTIEFWAKLDAPVGGADFILCGGTQAINQGLNIGFTSGSFFTMGFWGDDLNLNTSYSDNDWHHWACVFDEATDAQRVYRDGVLVGSRTTANGNFVGTGHIYIGRATWGETANVTVDELRFWEDVRTPTEVLTYMNSELLGTEAGLMAYYNFEDGTPEGDNIGVTTLIDNGNGSGRAGNNGHMIGFGLNGAVSNFVFAKNGINTTLPVELTAFSGKQVNNLVALRWATQSELHNERFEIEYRNANREWHRIGEVAGHGTTNVPQHYGFNHHSPQKGVNYYRLKQVDFDGRGEHSQSIAVNFSLAADLPAYLYPNPVNNILVLANASGTISIYSLYGTLVKRVAAAEGATEIDVDDLATGMYSVRVESASGAVQVLSFVK